MGSCVRSSSGLIGNQSHGSDAVLCRHDGGVHLGQSGEPSMLVGVRYE